jgi:hypothetical protein
MQGGEKKDYTKGVSQDALENGNGPGAWVSSSSATIAYIILGQSVVRDAVVCPPCTADLRLYRAVQGTRTGPMSCPSVGMYVTSPHVRPLKSGHGFYHVVDKNLAPSHHPQMIDTLKVQ